MLNWRMSKTTGLLYCLDRSAGHRCGATVLCGFPISEMHFARGKMNLLRWYPHPESNRDLTFRKRQLYPFELWGQRVDFPSLIRVFFHPRT